MKTPLAPWTAGAFVKRDQYFRNMMRCVRSGNRTRRRKARWALCLAKLYQRHGVPI